MAPNAGNAGGLARLLVARREKAAIQPRKRRGGPQSKKSGSLTRYRKGAEIGEYLSGERSQEREGRSRIRHKREKRKESYPEGNIGRGDVIDRRNRRAYFMDKVPSSKEHARGRKSRGGQGIQLGEYGPVIVEGKGKGLLENDGTQGRCGGRSFRTYFARWGKKRNGI